MKQLNITPNRRLQATRKKQRACSWLRRVYGCLPKEAGVKNTPNPRVESDAVAHFTRTR